MMTHELATFLVAALCFAGACGLMGFTLSQHWRELQRSSPAFVQARINFALKILPASMLLVIAILLLAIGLFSQGS
jgi:hypothetical protein